MDFIHFAIDLGTTNSLIAKSDSGHIKIFKNPKGFKEALPSVVAFRKNGILVGEKAREFKDRDPKNVFSSFKRKMGTDDSYWVEQNMKTISPVELSSFVLNELKTFIVDETPASVVITIPASFDTIQSNATKEAGKMAGFNEVVLLQEPIAACLAVFNQAEAKKAGKWLIYDLGGGTFDVALVEISEESLKVLDHEGNNFLGGLDFDIAIVKNVLIPQIRTQGNFTELCSKLESNSDSQDVLPIFNYLLFQAEQLKIELTSYPESYVDFSLTDDDGEVQDIEIKMVREQFNSLIEQPLSITIQLVKNLLEKNQVSATDFHEIVLVGGSTYSPYVKEKIELELGIKVNQQVDPTNAIVVGAAHYAANKESKLITQKNTDNQPESTYKINAVYESQSREPEELILLKSTFGTGYLYRMVRKDLGYDSGLQPLDATTRIKVPLKEKSTNEFTVEIYSEQGTCLEKNAASISITQGLFVIDGQPLPHDICIEVDDVEQKETKLEVIFSKNDILPLQKTIYRTVSRNLLTTNPEDELIINILEGSRIANPSTNQIIGCVSIKPSVIGYNIIRDSEIGITLNVSESRDLTVTASISNIDFEITNLFNPTTKSVHLNKLREELRFLVFKTEQLKKSAIETENYEQAEHLNTIHQHASEALSKIGMSGDIPSDTKYHIEEWKRQLYVEYDALTRNKRLLEAVEEYRWNKAHVVSLSEEPDFTETMKQRLNAILNREQEAIQSGNVGLIRDLKESLSNLSWDYRKASPQHLRGIYMQYKILLSEDAYLDMKRANQIVETADQILYRDNAHASEFHNVLNQLHSMLKPEYLRNTSENEGFDMKGTGLQ